jgi:hypothetical protein
MSVSGSVACKRVQHLVPGGDANRATRAIKSDILFTGMVLPILGPGALEHGKSTPGNTTKFLTAIIVKALCYQAVT